MKKNYFTLVLLSLFVYSLNSQTIVSTDPENRKAVVEELTGIHCWACPDGHRILNDAQKITLGLSRFIDNQGNLSSENRIENALTTPEGKSIDELFVSGQENVRETRYIVTGNLLTGSAIDIFNIDFIQVPCNAWDNRMIDSGVF